MDIVIPYITSRWDGTELKYALRGVEKHLSGVGSVFIIGDNPKLKNIIHIPCENDSRVTYKDRSIFLKIMIACIDERISDPFFYMNDDHFLLADYDITTFPNYYEDWPLKSDMYKQTMENTRLHATRFFDVHCPIQINKARFTEIVGSLDWDKKCGYCMKSVYANGLEGEYYPDMKIRLQHPTWQLERAVEGRKWFSICDHARGKEVEGLLKKLYTAKSKYE